jgi:hypothetical protein
LRRRRWRRRRWRRQGWCGGEGGSSRSRLPDAWGLRSRGVGSFGCRVFYRPLAAAQVTWLRSVRRTCNQRAWGRWGLGAGRASYQHAPQTASYCAYCLHCVGRSV